MSEPYRPDVPGLALARIEEGRVTWLRGLGVANTQTGEPITPDTVFQAASVSKPVTAWAVMQLSERGLLDLDDPVPRLLSRWQFPPSDFDAEAVTVRGLLSHTAGVSVPGYPGLHPAQPIPELPLALAGGVGCGTVRLEAPPGSGFRYSGGGYAVLQLLVEEVCGRPFGEHVRSDVLEPLGMTRSSFTHSPDMEEAASRPHNWQGEPTAFLRYPVAAAAGLLSTPTDLARFVSAGLPGPNGEPAGRGVLRPETVQALFTPQIETEGTWTLGYATRLLPNGVPIVFHTGANSGFTAAIAAAPEQGAGLVVLTNSDAGSEFMWDLIEVWEAKVAGLNLPELLGDR